MRTDPEFMSPSRMEGAPSFTESDFSELCGTLCSLWLGSVTYRGVMEVFLR
jgi:hypothetical protein